MESTYDQDTLYTYMKFSKNKKYEKHLHSIGWNTSFKKKKWKPLSVIKIYILLVNRPALGENDSQYQPLKIGLRNIFELELD